MKPNKQLSAILLFVTIAFAGLLIGATPAQLTDAQFWELATDSSEEDGYFRSDNLLSNETTFQYVIPDILKTAKQGRVYMGVGPEQNFTYIAALKPSMVFIVDIRHGNFDVQLLYKALFELSTDRVDFVFRLFSRKRPDGLTAQSTIREIFDAVRMADGNKDLYDQNLTAIEDQLMKKHGFPLTAGDREGVAWAYSNYYKFGPSIDYASSLSAAVPPTIVGATAGARGGRGGSGATYLSLMTANDGTGLNRSYLANEENFKVLKDLETRNLVVPVVGNFEGDKAIRAVGRYLKSVDAPVSAFYLSNVEQFIQWDTFCRNVSSLLLDEASVFIRSGRGGPYTVNSTGTGVQSSSTAPILPELKCAPR